jgi:hypothetical protein
LFGRFDFRSIQVWHYFLIPIMLPCTYNILSHLLSLPCMNTDTIFLEKSLMVWTLNNVLFYPDSRLWNGKK